MRKVLGFVILSIIGFAAQARVEGRFLGQQYMINMVSVAFDGTNEETPRAIYNLMRASEQNSPIGMGKSLVTNKKEFSFICAKKAENNYQCSFIVFISPVAHVSLNGAVIQYTGSAAKDLYQQFYASDEGKVVTIIDDSGLFKLSASEDLFRLQYNL